MSAEDDVGDRGGSDERGAGEARPSLSPPGSAPILITVALAGAGTMTVELAAVRLLAPWFGASSGVWTNVIGVIMLALALGYLLGARLSCSGDALKRLSIVLLAAAACTVWLPFFARPIAQLFMPSGLGLDEAASLLVWGSLATALILFLPSALLLGCIGPLAVEVVQAARGGHAGDAGGRVLCCSTLGSLVGTFATTHLLLPELGLRWTFALAGSILGLLGIWLFLRSRARAREQEQTQGGAAAKLAPVLLWPILWFAGVAGGSYQRPDVLAGQELLASAESPYQSIRVIATPRDGSDWRLLQVNESLDSFQSVWQPETGLLPVGNYYNLFAFPAWWAEPQKDWSLLTLGLGAGTTVRVLEGALPIDCKLRSLGLEIDPEVVRLGQQFFELEMNDDLRRVGMGVDARSGLRMTDELFDQIVLDTYANNMEIPAHLSTVEFFEEIHAHLEDGGWLTVNAAGFGLDDPVVHAVAQTVARAFEEPILAVRVPFSRNCVLYARKGAPIPEPGAPDFFVVGQGAPNDRLAYLALDGAWEWIRSVEGAGLTDDCNPIDTLQRESIVAGRSRWVDGP